MLSPDKVRADSYRDYEAMIFYDSLFLTHSKSPAL